MSFVHVPRSMLVWKRQVKRIANWLVRLFFAATVAFAIPVSVMMSPAAIWKGMVVGAVACVLTKTVSGVFVGETRWVVGWAMVGRGEFAYLVADTARITAVRGSGRGMRAHRRAPTHPTSRWNRWTVA